MDQSTRKRNSGIYGEQNWSFVVAGYKPLIICFVIIIISQLKLVVDEMRALGNWFLEALKQFPSNKTKEQISARQTINLTSQSLAHNISLQYLVGTKLPDSASKQDSDYSMLQSQSSILNG